MKLNSDSRTSIPQVLQLHAHGVLQMKLGPCAHWVNALPTELHARICNPSFPKFPFTPSPSAPQVSFGFLGSPLVLAKFSGEHPN